MNEVFKEAIARILKQKKEYQNLYVREQKRHAATQKKLMKREDEMFRLRSMIEEAGLCPHEKWEEPIPNCRRCIVCKEWIRGPDGSKPL